MKQKNPVQSDENTLGQNNTTSNDVKINNCRNAVCSSALTTGLHFTLCDNTAKNTQKDPVVAVAGIGGIVTTALKLLRVKIIKGLITGGKAVDEFQRPIHTKANNAIKGWLIATKTQIKSDLNI